jgi:hypothetical protein
MKIKTKCCPTFWDYIKSSQKYVIFLNCSVFLLFGLAPLFFFYRYQIKNKKFRHTLFINSLMLWGLFALTVCGFVGCSGGNSSSTNQSAILKRGVFLDSAVDGLQYKTATQFDVTNANGEFKYIEGESIEFFIGDIILGQTMAKVKMTPVDLIPSATDETHPTVINISRFLLTLDEDDDPDNGILIPKSIRDEFQGKIVDFDLDPMDFEIDPQVELILDVLNATGAYDHVKLLVSAEKAEEHLRETLAENFIEQTGTDVITIEDVTIYDSFESPGPNPLDLTWDGSYLYNADPATGMVYRIDIETKAYTSFWIGYGIHGICFDNEHLYVSTVDHSKILKVNPNNEEIVESFEAPGMSPAGLVFAQGMIWVSDSSSGTIYQIDPANGQAVDYHPMPQGTNLHGLAYHNDLIYAVNIMDDNIVVLNPDNLEIVDSFPAPGADCHGMGWIVTAEGSFLAVADKIEKIIYLLSLY